MYQTFKFHPNERVREIATARRRERERASEKDRESEKGVNKIELDHFHLFSIRIESTQAILFPLKAIITNVYEAFHYTVSKSIAELFCS